MQPWKVIFVSKKHDNYKNVLNSLSDSNQIWAKNAEIFAIFSIFDDKNLKRKFKSLVYYKSIENDKSTLSLAKKENVIRQWQKDAINVLCKNV